MRRIVLACLALCFISSYSYSQYLSGRALRESGDAASRVEVRFANKENRVETKSDGSFRILATKLPDTLIFTSKDYEPYKVVITEKNIKDPGFEVVLLNKRMHLNYEPMRTGSEVVVTAMGVKRKPKEVGYSTRTIRSEEITGMPATRYYDAVDEKSDIKSGLITAGEVNDFNKWKMWEDYGETQFKSMSQFWGMFTSHRYSVQLTDKRFNAIVNERVYLINRSNGDTVWSACTDNTGKAELWGGFIKKDSTNTDFYISNSSGKTVNRLTEFANGVNLMVIDRSCNVNNEVDIAFVVDATGSMGDEIEFLKLELEDVIRNTMEKYKSLSLRAASVFYRDKGDEYVTKNVDFNEDLLKTINFIKLQSAGGGGDYPEAVDDALDNALNKLQWNANARTRLLFLVLDAPPHNEAKERIQHLTVKAASMGIRIIPVACSGTDKSTEFLLRSMALATNGTYAFLTNHSGIGNTHIEPTTDKYEVELLGNLLQRVIGQYLVAKDCAEQFAKTEPERQPENILKVKLYPNPTTGQFSIESNKELKEIYITDFTGKLLMRLNTEGQKGRWQVDMSQYPSAVYLVKYITADDKWGALKVVVSR